MTWTEGDERPERVAFPRPCLALITDRKRSALPLLEAVERAVAAGVDLVHLREGDLPPDELLVLARRLRVLTAGRALLLINGDADLARMVGGDGVHLPERGVSVAGAHASMGSGCLVGRSVHSVEAARQAQAEGADYVQVGAVFATASHPDRAPAGLDLVREVRAAVALPVLAVGGITPENAREVMAAGAGGVAVIGAILGSDDPGRAVRRLRAAMSSAPRAGD